MFGNYPITRKVARVGFVANHARAINKLQSYAADDSIEAERLHPLLSAVAGGDVDQIATAGEKILIHYAACDSAIDELLLDCAAIAKAKGGV